MRAVAGAIALVLIVGCGAQPDAAFPRYAPTTTSLLADNQGRLMREAGCLLLEGAGGPWMLLWPSTLSLRMDGGQLVIVDQASAVRATVGTEVAVSGGEFRDDEHALSITNGTVPKSCQIGLYWLVSSIRSVG